jgi:hypothetical protein
MEYQCFYLNPAMKLAHDDDAEVLFESNSLGECCNFVYEKFKLEKRNIGVYQPRIQSYRDLYQNRVRNTKGQYA